MTKEQLKAARERFDSGLTLEYEETDSLLAEVEHLTAEVARLTKDRESWGERLLAWRGIEKEEDRCPQCGGSGKSVYGSTTTWRGGFGGQQATVDVCDKCWGSGDKTKPFLDWRKAAAAFQRGAAAMQAQAAQWLERKAQEIRHASDDPDQEELLYVTAVTVAGLAETLRRVRTPVETT